VHSHINHLLGLLDAAKEDCVPQVYVHFFGDGRDTAPRSASMYTSIALLNIINLQLLCMWIVTYLKQLQEHMSQQQYGKLATITGRYYAMDRDRRWERIQMAVEGIIHGKGEKTTNPIEVSDHAYYIIVFIY
jgi:2,3-bisphosphoglycerate-independent phosphoglycerate mutase